jgi:hypothetical protein
VSGPPGIQPEVLEPGVRCAQIADEQDRAQPLGQDDLAEALVQAQHEDVQHPQPHGCHQEQQTATE